MATLRYISAALATYDKWTIVIGGTWVTADTVTLTVGARSVVITLGATVTTASIANAITEAWNGTTASSDATRSASGSDIPEFSEATASVSGSTVTVLMNTAGVPLGLSVNKSSTSGTATLNHVVTATGPAYWDNAANWSTGAVPVNSDTVWIDATDADILYGLAQTAVTLAALHIPASFTGTIGLPDENPNGYTEYRQKRLAIKATVENVGQGDGTGSGRIRRDASNAQTALKVYATGSALDTNAPAYDWLGTHASNTLEVLGGSVGVGVYGGEAATLATVNMSDGELRTGAGVTLSGALTVAGGTWNVNSLVDGSLTVTGGTVAIGGTGNVDQLTVGGTGAVTYNTTGTLGGNAVVEGGGSLDMGPALTTVTVSNSITLRGQNCLFTDLNKRAASVTFALTGGASPAQLNLKPNVTVAVS